jgi:arylformamidase
MRVMLLKLSHNLSERTPFYDGLPGPELEQLYDLRKGDTCNSFFFRTSNHAGTHVDAPLHFDRDGRSITDYDLSELVFTRPAVVDVPLGECELIEPSHLQAAPTVRPDCDIMLLRSGFAHRRRAGDARAYVVKGPGFSRSAAEYLLRRLPDLRAVALDFISIASMAHMEEGCDAHRVFLGCPGYGGRPILLVEDAWLPESLPVLQRVFVIPLFFEGLDSAPCTMFAEV